MQYAWENKNESIFPISFFDALDEEGLQDKSWK